MTFHVHDDGAYYIAASGESFEAGGYELRVIDITRDDDATPVAVTVQFGAASYTATEGGRAATVTVNLSADPERSVTIPITATGADGAGSGDYTLSETSVTIDSGETSATFIVTAADDSVDDDGESVNLSFGANLPDGVSRGAQATSTVSLVDDDGATPVAVTVEFGAASYTATEGGTAATVTVNLSADPERSVTIPITAAGAGGAGSGDYSLSATSVTIAGGSTSATFTVTATDDSVDDDGESVSLAFGTNLPDAVSEGTQRTATVSLTDNDVPQVTVKFGAASYTATEDGTAATVTVNLSADPERSVTIPITAAGAGGAGSGDYSLSATSVTIAGGSTSATFTVTATDDSDNDDGESVNLSFGANLPDGVSRGTQATSTVSLVDDDGATDTTAPTVDSATVSTDGATIEIVFDEDLDRSGSAPAADAFEVTVDFGTAVNPASIDFHTSDADTVVLAMSPAIAAGATVTVAYEKPTSNALADAASNEVESFTGTDAIAAPNRPAAPVVTLTAGDEKLTATWAAPANGGSEVTGYDVEWKTAAQTWAEAATAGQSATAAADATTHEITGLTNDTEYTVRVRAANDAGDGPWSAEASETPIAGDTTAPEVSSATVSSDGTTIDIVFDEDLDRTGSAPAASAFEVTVDSGTAVNPDSVDFHASDADTVVLTMSPAIAAGGTVTVAYDKPTSNALADAASNEVADFTGQAAPNRPAAPVVTLTPASGKLTATWAVPANGGSEVTGYDVEWKTAAQTWAEAATAGQSDTAAADATTHEITGLTNDTEYTVRVRAANDAGDGPWSAEASETPIAGDTTAPEVSSATVSTDGTTIDIVFDEDLDRTGSAPAASAFEVTVDSGTAVNPDSVDFHASDADTVVLTMSPAIAAGGTVTVAYDKPTSNALADAASNEVADFTGQAAPNRPAGARGDPDPRLRPDHGDVDRTGQRRQRGHGLRRGVEDRRPDLGRGRDRRAVRHRRGRCHHP